MRNIHKPNNTRPSTGGSGSGPRVNTVRKAKEIILDEATRPLYGVQSFAEVTPIRLCKRSLPDSIGDKLADDITGGKVIDDSMTQNYLQHHLDRNEITANATDTHTMTQKDLQNHLDRNEIRANAPDPHAKNTKETKGSPRKTYYRRRGHRGHRRGHSMRARHRRSINTDYVSKRGKAVDFITAVKMSPAPPIVRVVPPDPIYYRHGRADEKLFSQSFNRDVQDLIRHNVQHYIKSDHLEVTPNGHNDYLNRIEAPRSGRRIVYYATLPEIVRRPSVPLEEYWTNYMIPRELSGTYLTSPI
uniref:Uncharacterized protein n=1 Tax=Cacopsylla melanoneura TaxID=428564 RepID=A0A8D9F285_9HEMI